MTHALFSSIGIQREEVGITFYTHIKTATYFGHTYVTITRMYTEFLLSWFYIQPDDSSTCLAETRSCFYKCDKNCVIIIIINIKNWTLWSVPSPGIAARANASSVFQLFSFPVVCSDMISNGFGFVAFFEGVETSSVCIHLSVLACM